MKKHKLVILRRYKLIVQLIKLFKKYQIIFFLVITNKRALDNIIESNKKTKTFLVVLDKKIQTFLFSRLTSFSQNLYSMANLCIICSDSLESNKYYKSNFIKLYFYVLYKQS